MWGILREKMYKARITDLDELEHLRMLKADVESKPQ